MSVQLRHLRYFSGIVEAGSISRAAAALHVAQSALSQQLAELELDLGVPLLHRSARGVRPTPAGEILYREAISILGRVGQLTDLLRVNGPEVHGAVSIGASSTLASLFKPFLEMCQATLPKVTLRCVTGDGISLKNKLGAHSLDIACAFEDEPEPAFARRQLFRQTCYLIHREPLSGGPTTISLHELAALPLVLPIAPNVVRSKLDRIFSEASLAPRITAEGDVMSTVLQAVQAGIGATILPKANFSDVPGYTDLLVTRIEPAIELTASALWLAHECLTPAAEGVRDLLMRFADRQWHASLPMGAGQLEVDDDCFRPGPPAPTNSTHRVSPHIRGPQFRVVETVS